MRRLARWRRLVARFAVTSRPVRTAEDLIDRLRRDDEHRRNGCSMLGFCEVCDR